MILLQRRVLMLKDAQWLSQRFIFGALNHTTGEGGVERGKIG